MSEKAELLKSLRIEREGEAEEAPPAVDRRLVLAAVAAGAFVMGGAVGWIAKPAPTGEGTAGAEDEETAQTSPSASVPPAGGLVASGYVVARRQATVAAEVTGRVLEVRVEEGQQVRRGDVLGVLEPTLARAELDSARSRAAAAEADLAEARRVLTRTEALAKQGFASDASLTAAQSRVSLAEAQFRAGRSDARRASAQLSRFEIRAPFSGIVTDKNAQPGEIISPVATGGFTRTGICTIVDMESLEIEVDVSEAFISRVRTGQRVQAVLDAYPDLTFPAHVIAPIPRASRDRATVRVRIGFDRLDPRILPEMAIKVTFLEGANSE